MTIIAQKNFMSPTTTPKLTDIKCMIAIGLTHVQHNAAELLQFRLLYIWLLKTKTHLSCITQSRVQHLHVLWDNASLSKGRTPFKLRSQTKSCVSRPVWERALEQMPPTYSQTPCGAMMCMPWATLSDLRVEGGTKASRHHPAILSPGLHASR